MKVIRIIPVFRILRLIFHKSQPQNLELDRLYSTLIYIQFKVLRSEFLKFRILEILSFHSCLLNECLQKGILANCWDQVVEPLNGAIRQGL